MRLTFSLNILRSKLMWSHSCIPIAQITTADIQEETGLLQYFLLPSPPPTLEHILP